MNGYVHGVEFVNGFAYYKIIIIVWDLLAAAGIGVLVFFLVKKIRRYMQPETEESVQSETEVSVRSETAED